ncbi:AraC family transcriptional regulator [Mangrovimonas aestuarii]|uniref:AraC family transcriptional regulator n=1 Tax=Mangrovimonas aestuarii TaxID=3018443 RepID=UPI002378982E|nr:helix-turn-helix transcriptional regulator [Mangrovimonas aestuarii]
MRVPVLNIKQFQKSKPLTGFYVNSFSNHIKLNEDLISKPHSHDFYLCVIFTEGTGIHEIDFNTYSINPGKVFFLKPGQTHFWKFDSQPEGFIFFHSQEFYELNFLDHKLSSFPFYYSYQNPSFLQISENDINYFNSKFQEVFEEQKRNDIFRELKIVSLINCIYIDLTRAYTPNINLVKFYPYNYLKILEQLETLIEINFYDQKFPKFYASELNITTKHLNRVVKETLDKTTSELISERVMLEAKRLIVHSNNNLAGIAYTLEFSDYAYFSKMFKSKTGLSPMGFRKKYKN